MSLRIAIPRTAPREEARAVLSSIRRRLAAARRELARETGGVVVYADRVRRLRREVRLLAERERAWREVMAREL